MKNYNVHLASLSDEKLMYDFAKEMYFDVKATSNKSTRDRSLRRLLISPGILLPASGISTSRKKKSFSNTLFLSSHLNELCDRLNLLIQEEQAGNNSNILVKESLL